MLIVLIFPPRWTQARVLVQGGIQWLRAWLVTSHRFSCVRLKGNLWEYKETKTKLTVSLSWQSVEGSGPKGESRCTPTQAGGVPAEEGGTQRRLTCRLLELQRSGCSPLQSVWGENPKGHRHKSELEGMAVIWAHDACSWELRQGPLGEVYGKKSCAMLLWALALHPVLGLGGLFWLRQILFYPQSNPKF